jgi:oxygen-independent coproporphyrinogen III oxidase
MTKNAYIHIPFCRGKCCYCSFTSYVDLSLKEAYLTALKTQIKEEYAGGQGCAPYLNTLYIGGGTPSLLSINELLDLISLFNLENDAEITIEVNPDSVDFEYLSALRALGVNRLSIGIQTFDDEILNLIGRIHNSKQAFEAVDAARRAAFDNISVDFIYGLPNQTIEGFEQDLKMAVGLGVQHISLYGLKIEKGCSFYVNNPQNLPDFDLQADMYLKAVDVLKSEGFEHYEISNLAKTGFESKHNLNYWNANTYYGFGCSACGYFNNIRYTNQSDLQKYIQNPLEKISEQKLSEQEILEEAIFLGLRKIAGININEINQRFRIDFNKKYEKILKKYSDYFIKTQNGYALNINGILVSNEILSEFID